VGDWPGAKSPSRSGIPRLAADGGSVILWRDEAENSPLTLAGAIAEAALEREGQGESSSLSPLAVPAPTFIAGRSTSTFALAWALMENGLLPEWGAVLSSCQTEGRGQMRRHWHSPRGNLHVTFRLPADSLLKGDAASLITGYILVAAFRSLGFPLSLKWPNDLLLDERAKAGGILLEEKNGILLAGMGVNLVEAPSAAMLREGGATPAAVLLPDASHAAAPWIARLVLAEEPLAPFLLWRQLVSKAILSYSRAVKGRRLPELLSSLDPVLAWKGREVVLYEGTERSLSGRFLGLGPGGGLCLRLEHGETREVFSGSLALAEY
jgi:BirA family biotin operon repressor/biotin-[acetyl-CoA-carboxylase] ligase